MSISSWSPSRRWLTVSWSSAAFSEGQALAVGVSDQVQVVAVDIDLHAADARQVQLQVARRLELARAGRERGQGGKQQGGDEKTAHGTLLGWTTFTWMPEAAKGLQA